VLPEFGAQVRDAMVAASVSLGAVSVAAGILNAACMTY